MLEIHEANEAARVLRHGDRYVYWAPGDATLYRVTLITAIAYDATGIIPDNDLVALLVLVGRDGHNPHLLVQRPCADYDRWTAETFYRAFGERYVGWWAGVRPLLAALEWTPPDEREVAYTSSSAVEIVQAAGRVVNTR